MGFGRAFFIRRAFTNSGFTANNAGLSGIGFSCFNSFGHGVDIVAVYVGHHVPTVASEALRNVFAKPAIYVAINGDIVVVVQHNQFA